jgi:hypothetical protein
MSAPGRTWHGYAQPETARPHASHQRLSDLREHIEELLSWAESTQAGEWHLADEEKAFMASVSDLFGVPIPLGTFRSAETAGRFLRVVALALKD